MKAIVLTRYGRPNEAFEIQERPTPEPAAGQVLVKLAAAGVNFIDTYQRSGLYKIPLPAVLGMEGAGTVESLGPDAAGFKMGDHVAWAMSRGSYAEFAAVPAQFLVKVPAALDVE